MKKLNHHKLKKMQKSLKKILMNLLLKQYNKYKCCNKVKALRDHYSRMKKNRL